MQFFARSLFFLSFLFIQVAFTVQIPDLTVCIPMRDGTTLPTDLYFPDPDARDLPCILLRSPAGRQLPWPQILDLAKEGYVIAIQDTRNVLDADGKAFPFLSDAWGNQQDGYDTVEWLAKSPYTNGKIGTWGPSALGITQLLMAPTNPPHLKCQYVLMAAACMYHHALFPGGQLLKHQAESWLGFYARDTGVLSFVSQRHFYDDFWKQFNTLPVAHMITTPGVHVGGWYDTFLMGTLTAFQSRQNDGAEGARGQQKLIVGPWPHFWPLSKQLGDFEVPLEGYAPPFDISPKSWFDFYLKDIDTSIKELPSVIYFVMGPFDSSSKGNVWRTANQWPVPSNETSFYLEKAGKLSSSIPESGEDSFIYDPLNPIPTKGGRNLFLPSGPMDQSEIEKRDDVLVYTTPPLEEDLEVTGYLKAQLYVKTNQPDTDIVVRLCDVYPDGRSILISEGGLRLGMIPYIQNRSLDLPSQNDPIPITIDLWATSQIFAKGHAIRVSVSSSNFPRYECNPNIGILDSHSGKFRQAKNRIYFGTHFPSRLLLPVVRNGAI